MYIYIYIYIYICTRIHIYTASRGISRARPGRRPDAAARFLSHSTISLASHNKISLSFGKVIVFPGHTNTYLCIYIYIYT